MERIITVFLSNFTFFMTVLALLCGLVALLKKSDRTKADIFLGCLFFFAVGLSGLWGFVFHAFFPEMAAKFIGWTSNPFQFEVAVANLGMGVVGIFGLRASKSYRIAATVFTTCFLWGAAFGHIMQMIKSGNFAPGNAGLIFYNDLLLPLLLIVFLFICEDKKNQY